MSDLRFKYLVNSKNQIKYNMNYIQIYVDIISNLN